MNDQPFCKRWEDRLRFYKYRRITGILEYEDAADLQQGMSAVNPDSCYILVCNSEQPDQWVVTECLGVLLTS